MGFQTGLRLDSLQTLGTSEPVELLAVYDATPFGGKERVGTNYLVKNGYGDQIRVRIIEQEPSISGEVLDDYKWAKTTPLVVFEGLTGRISTSKKGEPIICGMADGITLITPLPPTMHEQIRRFFEDDLDEHDALGR